jgi:uncharacterized DUF497 family protein
MPAIGASRSANIWIATVEAEEVLLGEPLCQVDLQHSDDEQRYVALGVAEDGRRLFVSFTVRRDRIRIISARPMSRKERRIYEKTKRETRSWGRHVLADPRQRKSDRLVGRGRDAALRPGYRTPTQTISVRLPRQLVRDLHVLAKTRNVSAASLVKMLLADKVAELRRGRAA